jgi:HEAT repeat protein
VLLDRAGDDQYQGGEYSQGAGGFLALGYLLDDEGRDRYGATERAQGFGLERGLGLLWDASGDDSYAADRLAQGAALTGGIGLAVDLTGDDAYLPGESSLGSVPEGDTSHAVALFVDGAGEDSHAGRDRDDLCWSGGPTGIGVDTEAGDLTRLRTSLPMGTGRLPFSSRQTLGPTDLRPVPGDLPPSTDLDQLWGQAAQSEDFRRRRDAVLAFSRLGEQAVPFLIAKLGEVDETQVKLAQEVLAQVGSPAVPELLRLMDEGTDREAAIAMGALARTDDQRAGTYLTRQAKSPQWRTRAAAAGAMGGQGGEDTRLALEQLLRDTDEDVRRAAVVALRRRGATDSAEAISNLLGDPVFAVRFAAADALVALVALGGRCPPHVFSLVGSGQPDIRYLSLETCGRLGSRQSLPMLISQLQSRDWTDRAFAAEAICRLGDPSACSALQGLLEAESNGIVLGKARAALKATRLCDGQP